MRFKIDRYFYFLLSIQDLNKKFNKKVTNSQKRVSEERYV